MSIKNEAKVKPDRAQTYDKYLCKPYLHDQRIERIVYINQILFVEMWGDCVEFHGVENYTPVDISKPVDWLHYEVKSINDKTLKITITLTRDISFTVKCKDIKVFNINSKKYYQL